jgi:NAD(P)-dependent dehydrogenase (short-subunit alcohol dehydrogenase family)
MTVDLRTLDPGIVERFGFDRLPFDRPATATADLLRLDGQRAIVTGGGGAGLGAAICHRLAEQGADVAVLDVSEEEAAASAEAVAARWGVRTQPLVADVGDPDQTRAAVARVVDRWGGVDVLVNNAGGSGSIGLGGRKVTLADEFEPMDIEDLVSIVRVNLLGVLLMSKAALGPMLAAGRGRIVNISSEGGKTSVDGLVVYNACKSGVIGFTRNLAREVGRRGVSVACVCPGIMVTDRTLNALGGPDAPARAASIGNGFSRVTIGRCSLPDEVASMVAFIASPAGAYVHGTAVSVGGGMSD